MKRIILLTAVLVGLASTAFAAAPTCTLSSSATTCGTPTLTFTPSQNVTMAYNSGAGGGTGLKTYAITSGHTSGNKYYATTSLDTSVRFKDTTTVSATDLAAGTGVLAAPGATTGTYEGWVSGWSSI